MRGRPDPQITMVAFIDLEERVPPDHPLRTIRRLADSALAILSATWLMWRWLGGTAETRGPARPPATSGPRPA